MLSVRLDSDAGIHWNLLFTAKCFYLTLLTLSSGHFLPGNPATVMFNATLSGIPALIIIFAKEC